MRTAILLLSAALAIPASAARVEQIALDLERPKRQFALSFAEAAGTTVRAQLRASGTEFDPDGWAGLLWYGNEDGGIVITNTASDFGVMEWAVPASSVPTNGRYVVQILGQSGATIEEWGVGTLIVRESLSQYAMPADWMSGNAAWIAATNALALAQAAATTQQLAEAVAPLAATNTILYAALANEASLREAGDTAGIAALHATNTLLHTAITNEAALREAADDAGADALAGTNTILYAAITNEAAIRAAADASKLDRSAGTATNLNLVSEWQTLSGVTGSVTLTNLADRPIQCTGTGAVSLAFSGLKPPRPVYLTLGGFNAVTWPTNTYAVGGWGAWQTNRLNHVAVWQVGTNLYVNQITTSEE